HRRGRRVAGAAARRRRRVAAAAATAHGRARGAGVVGRTAPRAPRRLSPPGTTVNAMPFTPTEAAALDALDEQALVQRLVDLVQAPSITGSAVESERQHAHAQALRELGGSVDAWKLDLDALREHPDFPGTEAPRREGYGVVGTFGGDSTGPGG